MASGYRLSSTQGYPDFSASISEIGSSLSSGLEGIFKVRGGYSEAAEERKRRLDEAQLSRIGGLASQYSVIDRRKIDNGIDRAELYMMGKVYNEAISQAELAAKAKALKDEAELKIKQTIADGALASEKLALQEATRSGDILAQAVHLHRLQSSPYFTQSSPETQSVVNQLAMAMNGTSLEKGGSRSILDAVSVAMNQYGNPDDRGAALLEAMFMSNNSHVVGALNVGLDSLFGEDVVDAAWARHNAVDAYLAYLLSVNPQAANRVDRKALLTASSTSGYLSAFDQTLGARIKLLEDARRGLMGRLDKLQSGKGGDTADTEADLQNQISMYTSELDDCRLAATADMKEAQEYLDGFTVWYSMAARSARRIAAIKSMPEGPDGVSPEYKDYMIRSEKYIFDEVARDLLPGDGPNSIQSIVKKTGVSSDLGHVVIMD